MSHGPSCGVWPTRRGLVAVVLDADGVQAGFERLPDDDGERVDWLFQVERNIGPELTLVFPERLGREGGFARLALARGDTLWLAPDVLIDSICSAAWSQPKPRQIAGMLARLPHVRELRGGLRRFTLRDDPRQLALL